MNAPGVSRGSLRWYWNRMRVMHPLELSHRAASALGQTIDRIAVPMPAIRKGWLPPPAWLASAHEIPAVDAAPFLHEADGIAHGFIERVDGRFLVLGTPPVWDRPRRALSNDPARPTRVPGLPVEGEVRFEMELHRHGHLVRLAQAWRLGGQPHHLAALLLQLESWLEQCPCPRGVAWSSALDAGLRLLNWSLAWQLLQADREDSPVPLPLRQRWLASIYQHARFVRQHRSRHSSANNHLIGELLGLVVAEATWPAWQDVVTWGAAARRELVHEALRQTHEDGVNREQASWYQGFLFELLAVFVQIERARERTPDPRLTQRMGSMARFIAALRNARGQLSHHGDADHARALMLDAAAVDAPARLLALAVDLGVAPELAPLVDGPSQITPWLVGPVVAAPRAAAGTAHAVRSLLPRAFPQGGYHLLGSGFGRADEVLMVVDTGALGYLGIAAHGHADALSLRLSVAGQALLVDRGSFVYNAEPEWRHFFRGTLAHNTVCIDDADQSKYGGPFLWLRHALCELESFASDDMAGHVQARHDGYRRLAQPVMHTRRVEWHGTARRFQVIDTLAGRGSHAAAVAWHFAPGCRVEIIDGTAHIGADGVSLRLVVDSPETPGHWELHHGAPGSMLGWHSPAFGQRIPAPTLLWRTRISGTSVVRSSIDIHTS
ncbi:heparinase II/III domain-containing protein [Rhizobacter sp. P5_C2]